jgi:hypothetical protein
MSEEEEVLKESEKQKEEIEEEDLEIKNTWIEEIYLKIWKKREKTPLTMKELLERFIEPESPVYFVYFNY